MRRSPLVTSTVARSRSDLAVTRRPAAVATFAPRFFVRIAPTGAEAMIPIASGMNRTPVSSADSPSTPWRYYVRKNSTPMSEKKTSVTDGWLAAAIAEEADVEHRLGDATLPGEERGEEEEAALSEATMVGSSQPRAGTSMMPKTSATRPATDRIAPIGSRAPARRETRERSRAWPPCPPGRPGC